MDIILGRVDDIELRGAETGWPSLDTFYRVVPGEVTVLTGTPGSGKTEFLVNLVLNLAERYDWKIGLCLFEIAGDMLTQQLLEKRHRVHVTQGPESLSTLQARGELDMDWILEHFFRMEGDFRVLNIGQLLERTLYLTERHGLKAIMIDPFNYLDLESGSRSETECVSELMSQLQRFAKAYKCHVFLVAHPTKMKRLGPGGMSLYNISGSAHFYNKCDMGIVLERNYDLEKGDSRELRVKVEKVRNNLAGTQGSTTLLFDWKCRRYNEPGSVDWGGMPYQLTPLTSQEGQVHEASLEDRPHTQGEELYRQTAQEQPA